MRRPLLVISALLLVAGCGDTGGDDDPEADVSAPYLVGDSTMEQIVAHTDARGSTRSGCGFTEDAPCLIPLDESITADVIVASVSYWDRNADEQQIADGYRSYHDRLSSLAPVVWVELPPNFIEGGDPSPRSAEALNAAVAGALGCELAPWRLREGPTYDGIHYFPPGTLPTGESVDGAGEAWAKLSELGTDSACPHAPS